MIGHMAGRVTSPICVGRQEELLVLDEAAERAAGGTASVVLVGGEAGVGKTRLIAEFSARSTVVDPLVLHGACISLGGDEGLPFGPIAQALRGLIRQLGPEATNALLDESTSELGRLVPELGRVVDEPGPSRPEWAQTRVFEGLLTLLGRLAELRTGHPHRGGPALGRPVDPRRPGLPRPEPGSRTRPDRGHLPFRRAPPSPPAAAVARRDGAVAAGHPPRAAAPGPRRCPTPGGGDHRTGGRSGSRGHDRPARRGQSVLHRGAPRGGRDRGGGSAARFASGRAPGPGPCACRSSPRR